MEQPSTKNLETVINDFLSGSPITHHNLMDVTLHMMTEIEKSSKHMRGHEKKNSIIQSIQQYIDTQDDALDDTIDDALDDTIDDALDDALEVSKIVTSTLGHIIDTFILVDSNQIRIKSRKFIHKLLLCCAKKYEKK